MSISGKVATRWCALLFGATLCATRASGQTTCSIVGDDGFDVGCCVTPVTPNIATIAWPELVLQQAAYAGIDNCLPFNQNSPFVTLRVPTFPYCDYAIADFRADFLLSPGMEVIKGLLYMKYARTWLDGLQSQTQVWRFLVNGDLDCGGPIITGCASVIPPCWLDPNNTLGPGVIHWDGHVDYACTQGTWSVSLSLNHVPGIYVHDAASCFPEPPVGPYSHYYESYHLVFPAPFSFVNAPPLNLAPPTGLFVADAVRRSLLQVPSYSCMSEIHTQLLGGLFFTSNLSCMNPPPGPMVCAFSPTLFCQCWEEQALIGQSCAVAGTSMSFQSIALGPPLPPTTGFAAMTVGQWPFGALPNYPWAATLTLYLGTILAWPDPCSSMNPIHVVTGVSTSGEPPFHGTLFNSGNCTCGSLLTSHTFIDLNNVLLLGNLFLPGYGCAAASDLVLNLNLP